nr:immunoglobulin heavy chain junction region [Macaca mulatta]MOW94149.1 immunoglobulin heavy chain junction region [Macaca mulatta]MOW97461.1 immunoglobulin heavy chain junction region [Macaca mulatta]
CTTRRGAFDLW